MEIYQESKEAIFEKFSVTIQEGLTPAQVVLNREKYGENRLPEEKEPSYWKVFLKSFKEPIVIVLLGAVALSSISAFYSTYSQGNRKHGKEALYEAVAILLLIIINAVLNFWQELSARKSLKALKDMNSRSTIAVRSGVWQTISAVELVVGDIIKANVGDFVEADVRWVEANELQVVEAHLTGEADAISKTIDKIQELVELGDQINMGFSGSMVTNGKGVGIVIGTGQNTELGTIASLIQSVGHKQSPLQQTINQLTRIVMKLSLGIVAFTFLVGMIRAGELSIESITDVLSTSIALAVASIPDALPAVLSIVLTIGATNMAKNKGVVKSLSSVETLGATSFICSDKTGTLTKNEMTVTKFYENGHYYSVSGLGYAPIGTIVEKDQNIPITRMDSLFIKGVILCNDAAIKKVKGMYQPFGNPTEVALIVLGEKLNSSREKLLMSMEIIRTLPFTSNRKKMSVVVKQGTSYFIYTKGAPDVLLTHCEGILMNGAIDSSKLAKNNFSKVFDTYAQEALRTLAVGYRLLSENEAINGTAEEVEQNLIISGVAGIIDPAREEVKLSIKTLHKATIQVVMITGDHEKTAQAIAYELGITSDQQARVIKGSMMEQMSDEELFKHVQKTRVYARVSPEQKQRIVRQLQQHGQIVAMTGDGINDAPALRAADVGISMGITGTEVTKEAADLILLDDNFTTIEKSVKGGRTIYGNIKNFMRHELTTNVAEVLSLLLGLLFFTQSIGEVSASTPTLTALMVLWVNMVSDAIPSFSLGYDVAESAIMLEKPRNPRDSILANYTWSRVLIRGIAMGVSVYVAFLMAAQYGMSSNQAQTVAFLTLVYGQLWHVFDARSSKTLFRRNPFENKYLVVAVLFAGLSSFLVTILPFFHTVMGTARLSKKVYLFVIIFPALPTLLLSGLKEVFTIKIW